jgi:hypothetical protein
LEDQDEKKPKMGNRALRQRNRPPDYGTGSLHILKEDFVDLAVELQQLANRLGVALQEHEIQSKKGLLQ